MGGESAATAPVQQQVQRERSNCTGAARGAVTVTGPAMGAATGAMTGAATRGGINKDATGSVRHQDLGVHSARLDRHFVDDQR